MRKLYYEIINRIGKQKSLIKFVINLRAGMGSSTYLFNC